MQLTEALKAARDWNGASLKYNGKDWDTIYPDSGYMVSAPGGIENLPILHFEIVVQFLAEHPEILTGVSVLGLWNSAMAGEPERWSVDQSYHVIDRCSAIEWGQAASQRAIYDCENDEVIEL